MKSSAERLWYACSKSAYVKYQLSFAREALDAENSAVLLLDEPGENLVFCASVGNKSDITTGEGNYQKALRVSMGAGIGINLLAVLYSKPMSMEKPDARHNPAIDQKTGITTRNLYAIPLAANQVTLGTFSTVNVHQQATQDNFNFSRGDTEALHAVADALSLWIAREWEAIAGDAKSLRNY